MAMIVAISSLQPNSADDNKAFACIGGRGNSLMCKPKGFVNSPCREIAPSANSSSNP
jgi:hypothetical protein